MRNVSPVTDDLGRLLENVLSGMRAKVEALKDDEDSPFGNCTACAIEAIRQAGQGAIWGYEHAGNPAASLGETEGGHDFAIIGHYLVDHWANDYYEEPWIYDLNKPADVEMVVKQYGDPALWGNFNDSAGRFLYGATLPPISCWPVGPLTHHQAPTAGEAIPSLEQRL